ncbi:hypothetical protein PtB15_15B123 [Puccinia triticina]|nr:hypothetical protein PtB15_15B123 [Puccinia triticina]
MLIPDRNPATGNPPHPLSATTEPDPGSTGPLELNKHPLTNTSNPSNPSKRIKTSRACDSCRAKKIRCEPLTHPSTQDTPSYSPTQSGRQIKALNTTSAPLPLSRSRKISIQLAIALLQPDEKGFVALLIPFPAELVANQATRINTGLHYKQQRFNLLHEESEGYSHLATELISRSTIHAALPDALRHAAVPHQCAPGRRQAGGAYKQRRVRALVPGRTLAGACPGERQPVLLPLLGHRRHTRSSHHTDQQVLTPALDIFWSSVPKTRMPSPGTPPWSGKKKPHFLPDGSYKLLVRALRISGRKTDEPDYKYWVSPQFRLKNSHGK